MKITVIVPTYRRPNDLVRCLEAIKQQKRPADEVLIIVRDTDTETWALLERFDATYLPLRIIKVNIPGQVSALNAGLNAAIGEIIAITDDDAEPYSDWLAKIETHFLSDSCIAGVGGRDRVFHQGQLCNGSSNAVGHVQWFGRVIGNHHLGVGPAREVEILKGVNMSYRASAIANIRFDHRLRGTGAQIHNDLAFSLKVRKSGWTLIYDPEVMVNHYPAQRFDEDQRGTFSATALTNIAHNETLTLLEYLSPMQRTVFLFWMFLIGTRATPGVLQVLRFFSTDKNIRRKWLATMVGRYQGYSTWNTTRKEPI